MGYATIALLIVVIVMQILAASEATSDLGVVVKAIEREVDELKTEIRATRR